MPSVHHTSRSLPSVTQSIDKIAEAESQQSILYRGHLHVTNRKERLIGAIGTCVGTRRDPHAHPMHGFAPRAHSAHVTECARRSNPLCSGSTPVPYSAHRSAHGMCSDPPPPHGGGGLDMGLDVIPRDRVKVSDIERCFRPGVGCC